MKRENIKEILTKALSRFNLNLSGARILTEAATGHYFVTPILAALSGAKVLAVAKDSIHGDADKAIAWVKKHAEYCEVEKNITFTKNLSEHDIYQADIITNLGFVRPIDKEFLKSVNNKAVISLFCEAWEVRKEDIDLDYCRSNEIPLLATNEDASSLNVFSNVGPLVLKMISQTNLKIKDRTFLLISGDKFGKIISEILLKNGAKINLVDPKKITISEIDLKQQDAVIIADYTFPGQIIGNNGIIPIIELLKNQHLHVIHLTGAVDSKLLKKKNIKCYPGKDGLSFRMSETFSFLGIQPVVDLHTAGLKVGQELFKASRKYADFDTIIKEALKNPLCQSIQ